MTEQFLTMRDGHKIFTRILKQQDAIGHIHIVHGMAEHSGRYMAFAEMLTKLGYTVSMHDTRGHGRTVDENGIVGHLADEGGAQIVVDDVYEVIEALRTHDRFILFGHSMGSFIVRRYTQLYSETLAGAIYCATAMAMPIHTAGAKLASLLTATQGGRTPATVLDQFNNRLFNIKISNKKTVFDWLSTDEEEVQKFIDDPKCGFCSTNQFYSDLLRLIIDSSDEKKLQNIDSTLPILLISGGADPVGDYAKGIFKVANKLQAAGLQEVIVYIFERMRHELLNEKNKQHVYDVIKWWLKKYE